MNEPKAFTLFQEFAPAPQQKFQMDRHYLLYAAKGAMRLQADGKSWFLPPARAALITANHAIEITIVQQMTVCSALFDPAFTVAPPAALSVFEMSPLARELILSCGKYDKEHGPLDAYASQLFLTLSMHCWQLAADPSPAFMPLGRHPHIIRALAWSDDNLSNQVMFGDLASAIGTTERSLARKFAADLGLSWGQAFRRMRMIRAMELLSTENESVVNISLQAGYQSLSAFNASFRKFTGQSPKQFRNSLAQIAPAVQNQNK